jgi:hypothetical protein
MGTFSQSWLSASKLKDLTPLIEAWKLQSHSEDPQSVLENGQSVSQVKLTSIQMHKDLIPDLQSLQEKVQEFINRGGTASSDEVGMESLGGQFNYASQGFKTLVEDVDRIATFYNTVETKVYADMEESMAHHCLGEGPCDCISGKMNKDPNRPRVKRVDIAPAVWCYLRV